MNIYVNDIYVNEIQCNNSNLFLQIFQIFQYIYIYCKIFVQNIDFNSL